MTGAQETGNQELHVRNWQLKKKDWEKIGSKKNPEKNAGILEKWLGPKKRKAQNSN